MPLRNTPPSDATSLLVPVQLDAWVVNPNNQDATATYRADYDRLKSFESPIPAAFNTTTVERPVSGVHLHWALPDALTRGRAASGSQMEFPLVPNRWLVLRFGGPTEAGQAPWPSKLWVVESDYLTQEVGALASVLDKKAKTLTLAPPGARKRIPARTKLWLLAPDGQQSAWVTTVNAVEPGTTQLSIESGEFSADALPVGSTLFDLGTSEFLDPDPAHPTKMDVVPGEKTRFDIRTTKLGKSYAVAAWEATPLAEGSPLFLRAVGPGNVSFSAYVPFVENVFSFIDTELPAVGPVSRYTYLVTGWYSDPAQGDPLRGLTTYLPGVWPSEADWQAQTAAERFATLLAYLGWSVGGEAGYTPPATSLYHGLLAGVQWPYAASGTDVIKPADVQVAIGNTAVDALAALIQAQAQKEATAHPTRQQAWLTAGNAVTDLLDELLRAAMTDSLDEYGKPGGAALIRERIQQTWFGSEAGGTTWEVVGIVAPPDTDQPTETNPLPSLTPAQTAALNAQLATLNRRQRTLDEKRRRLEAEQGELYRLWLKVGRANSIRRKPPTTPPWDLLKPFMEQKLYPEQVAKVWTDLQATDREQAQLPPLDEAEAQAWAAAAWTFPADSGGGTVTLLDLGLQLKAVNNPRFWHPTDPVLLLTGLHRTDKHGQDGRYAADGLLRCRLPGQTIAGLQLFDPATGQPGVVVDVAAMAQAGVDLRPYAPYTAIPALPGLVGEAFFAEPANARLIVGAAPGFTAEAIAKVIGRLLQQAAEAGGQWWSPTVAAPAPVPFALAEWRQAWAPLFLEWRLKYYPTEPGPDVLRHWTFDGEDYGWQGSGLDTGAFLAYQGRTLLTPQTSFFFKAKIQDFLKNHPALDSGEMKQLLDTVASWDLVSQSLSGFTNQLITLLSQETFPPPARQPGAAGPEIGTLIDEQYHAMPLLQGQSSAADSFQPIRAGFIRFEHQRESDQENDSLQIVDAFGQTFWASQNNTGQGFVPLISPDLTPTTAPTSRLPGLIQLPPRVVPSTRLDVRFLANDKSGQDTTVADNPNPVCGWILPNHLDQGLAVYDAAGVQLGEVVGLPAPYNWRPHPGGPVTTPADIPNAELRRVITSIAAQPAAVFHDLLKVVDETLWLVDPLGGRKDQLLSVLIGRPLAIVQTTLQLNHHGHPPHSQLWNQMAEEKGGELKPVHDTGKLGEVAFPVRLGSLDLRDDGLIGYFRAEDFETAGYSRFYASHVPHRLDERDTFVQPIMRPAGTEPAYAGNLHLRCGGEATTVTLLLDPRGSVHAYTGILPVVAAALPPQLIEDFLRQLKVTFQAGPILTDPGTLRLPRPAEERGTWSWIQAVAAPADWLSEPIVEADDRARMPEGPMELREGWLQLSDLDSTDRR